MPLSKFLKIQAGGYCKGKRQNIVFLKISVTLSCLRGSTWNTRTYIGK